MSRPIEDPVKRFWRHVIKQDGCWEWGGPFSRGRAIMTVGRKNRQAARFSWEVHYGEIPEKMCVCHKCDNPRCVNPDCLFLGTRSDNNRDRDNKGRTSRGSSHASAKLNDHEVACMKKFIERNRHGCKEFASRWFGISKAQVFNIIGGYQRSSNGLQDTGG